MYKVCKSPGEWSNFYKNNFGPVKVRPVKPPNAYFLNSLALIVRKVMTFYYASNALFFNNSKLLLELYLFSLLSAIYFHFLSIFLNVLAYRTKPFLPKIKDSRSNFSEFWVGGPHHHYVDSLPSRHGLTRLSDKPI